MTHLCKGLLAALFTIFSLSIHAADAPEAEPGGRAMAVQIEAVVTDVDLETREVTLQTPTGNYLTLSAQEKVIQLENVAVGDVLVATYLAALEGELRAPTEEEKAEPWVVLEEGGASEDPAHPGVAGARSIRAVVTIEGMNRLLGTVTVMDSRGKVHLITDVEPQKMEGVVLGQTAVLVFTEALALSLEKPAS